MVSQASSVYSHNLGQC